MAANIVPLLCFNSQRGRSLLRGECRLRAGTVLVNNEGGDKKAEWVSPSLAFGSALSRDG